MNEYRGADITFHLRSIGALNGPAQANRIERGFVGSHADIGGGYGTGDLSDVALMWMVQQAKSSGVSASINDQKIRSAGWDVVSSPILHDKSGNKLFPQSLPSGEDRNVIYTDGKVVAQRKAIFAGMTNPRTRDFVSYLETYCDVGFGGKPADNPEVGNVKMDQYAKWLEANFGLKMSFNNSGRQACAPL